LGRPYSRAGLAEPTGPIVNSENHASPHVGAQTGMLARAVPRRTMSDSAASDDALVSSMALGDEAAVAAFVRRYQGRVYGLALSMLSDPVLAQDIAQEAFLRVWRHALVFDRRRASVSTWVLTITRNLAVDALRLRRPVVTDRDDLMWAGLASRGPQPDERTESSEKRGRLVAALASLPAEQSRAVVLAVYGFTADEISRADGVPLSTAKTRVRRGLLKLRALAPSLDLAGLSTRSSTQKSKQETNVIARGHRPPA
jgi:RNA polymerase sigma factor (sigma-70 family)